MSYAERSLAWFFKNRFLNGFSTLLDSKMIFFTLITLIWLIMAPISLVLYNFLGPAIVKGILQLEIAIILSFLISGLIINFISSTKIRILLASVILCVVSSLIFLIIPEEVQYLFPIIGSISFAGIFGLSYFIIIRFFNTSWVGRMMMLGKSPKKLFMHRIAMLINIVCIAAPIYLLVRYFQGLGLFDLILVPFGFLAWGIVIYATARFPDYPSYDIYASMLSATNFIVFIFFFLYVGEPILVIVFDVILLLFGISALIQFLHSRRKVEKVAVYAPKSIRSPEDTSIIIIQEEETQDDTAELPVFDENGYALEEESTEVRTHTDGFIVIILGLTLSFHFILLHFLSNIVIGAGFITMPFQFTIFEFHFALLLFGYILLISLFTAFKISLRFRGYTTKTMSEQAAFVKFLALIAEEERKRFLKRISKMVKDILVGGLSDFIEEQRQRWSEGLREGRKLLRRLFGTDEE